MMAMIGKRPLATGTLLWRWSPIGLGVVWYGCLLGYVDAPHSPFETVESITILEVVEDSSSS